MKMLSIDVGIKNLACVILDFDPTSFTPSNITEWSVLDLTDRLLCDTEFCNDVAVFQGNDDCVLCKKHAKKSDCGLSIPKPCDKIKNIKKLKLNELREYACVNGLENENENGKGIRKLKKSELFKIVENMIKQKYYTDIHSSRADQYDLITLGRMLKIKMDDFMKNGDIDIVCIENQISPIANRMKTLQGMITQYFIMTSECSIEFISSINKLKELNMEASSYSERKKQGIILCRNKIKEYNDVWCDFFEKSKKKDDLSDCYLQALFCIKRMRNNI